MGSRTDEAHVPGEDVEQLRQFVDRGAPQELADAGHPRVVLGRLLRAIEVRQVGPHGAELVDREDPAVPPAPRLPEEHRPLGVEPDGQRHGDEDRRQHEHEERGDEPVLDELRDAGPALDRRFERPQHRRPADGLERTVEEAPHGKVGREQHGDGVPRQAVHDLRQPLDRGERQRDDHLVDEAALDVLLEFGEAAAAVEARDVPRHALEAVVVEPQKGIVLVAARVEMLDHRDALCVAAVDRDAALQVPVLHGEPDRTGQHHAEDEDRGPRGGEPRDQPFARKCAAELEREGHGGEDDEGEEQRLCEAPHQAEAHNMRGGAVDLGAQKHAREHQRRQHHDHAVGKRRLAPAEHHAGDDQPGRDEQADVAEAERAVDVLEREHFGAGRHPRRHPLRPLLQHRGAGSGRGGDQSGWRVDGQSRPERRRRPLAVGARVIRDPCRIGHPGSLRHRHLIGRLRALDLSVTMGVFSSYRTLW